MPEGPEYFSPGQSIGRNDKYGALGNYRKSKTVRNEKIKIAEKSFRTESLVKNMKETQIQLFRPKHRFFNSERYVADELNCLHCTPGAAVPVPILSGGYCNFSLSGKKKIIPSPNVVEIKIN
ncbi:MAG TPA: hypothetical protein VLA03_06740 [Draconibacterium sp.]|nr:hypothetical protein [Draconibacterium sp.]